MSAYCLVIDEITIRCNSNWTMSTLHSAIQLLATTMRTIILRSTIEPGSIVDNSPLPRRPRASRDVLWRHTRHGRYHGEIRSVRVRECGCVGKTCGDNIIGGNGSAAVVETANCWQTDLSLSHSAVPDPAQGWASGSFVFLTRRQMTTRTLYDPLLFKSVGDLIKPSVAWHARVRLWWDLLIEGLRDKKRDGNIAFYKVISNYGKPRHASLTNPAPLTRPAASPLYIVLFTLSKTNEK